jgi:hypothetical protein
MLDLNALLRDTEIRKPHAANVTRRGGKRHVEITDPRESVKMPTPGGELTLFFDPPVGTGALREIRLIPGDQPWRLIPRLPLYLSYARAMDAMKQDDPDLAAALRALRDVGSGVRGHGDDFYRGVAALYNALVEAGESSPIKAIAESQPVSISAASKWVSRARELFPEAFEPKASA